MRLMVIGPRGLGDVEGGVEKYASAVLPLLARSGLRVSVACMARHMEAANYEGVTIVRLASWKAFLTDKHIYLLGAFLALLRERPDRVLLLGTASAFLILPLRLLGYKVFARCGLFDQHAGKWGSLARGFIHIANAQLRYASGVIAVSRDISEQLTRNYGVRRVVIIPNGLDKRPSMSGTKSSPAGFARYILAVGRVTAQKDYLTLVRAFKSAAVPDLELVIAGGADGSVREPELKELSGPGVRWLGRVDRRGVEQLFAGAAIYVNSSVVEGMSNAVLEAISFDCPVILSDIPANREVPAPSCSFFTPGNAEDLADRIRAATKDPQEFVANKEAMPSWADVADRTLTFICNGVAAPA